MKSTNTTTANELSLRRTVRLPERVHELDLVGLLSLRIISSAHPCEVSRLIGSFSIFDYTNRLLVIVDSITFVDDC